VAHSAAIARQAAKAGDLVTVKGAPVSTAARGCSDNGWKLKPATQADIGVQPISGMRGVSATAVAETPRMPVATRPSASHRSITE